MVSTIRKHLTLIISIALVICLFFVWINRLGIYDLVRLYNYHPPTEIVMLADETTMTKLARRVFYVNHPRILNKETFNQNCPNNGGEHTIILGCYHGQQTGIYLFNVVDPQLAGVEQITAAHELLHAVYARLNTSERINVDNLLQSFYTNMLKDERLLSVIELYKKSEPDEITNEMHSIFATEVKDLPIELENYYKKYFTNRQQVITFAEKYQQAFSSRRDQIALYDVQLVDLKTQITSNEAKIEALLNSIEVQRKQLDSYLESKQIDLYNNNVSSYNQKIKSYNNEIKNTQSLINQYNQIVQDRNSVAVEERQLIKSLDSRDPGSQKNTE